MVRLLVTSSGRSGSRWLARALEAAGVRASHEASGSLYGWLPSGHEVESSWLPLTYADELPDDLSIVHMVRSPFPCIASLATCEIVDRGSPYNKAAARICQFDGDRIADAARWWVAANETGVRLAGDWFWVESLTPGRLGDLAASSGVLTDPASLARALRTVVDPHPEPRTRDRITSEDVVRHLTLFYSDLLVDVFGLQQLLYQRDRVRA